MPTNVYTLLCSHVVVFLCVECIGTAFPIPLWSLAPIILGGLLILGILIIILLKIIFVILVSHNSMVVSMVGQVVMRKY